MGRDVQRLYRGLVEGEVCEEMLGAVFPRAELACADGGKGRFGEPVARDHDQVACVAIGRWLHGGAGAGQEEREAKSCDCQKSKRAEALCGGLQRRCLAASAKGCGLPQAAGILECSEAEGGYFSVALPRCA